jgi:hypothetical protein
MGRDTKLGYGFLLVGAAIPYLIEQFVGAKWALTAASVCMVAGVLFLIAAHVHREPDSPPRTLKSKVSIGVLLAAVAFAIGFAGFRVYSQPLSQQKTSTSALPEKAISARDKATTQPSVSAEPIRQAPASIAAVVPKATVNPVPRQSPLAPHKAPSDEKLTRHTLTNKEQQDFVDSLELAPDKFAISIDCVASDESVCVYAAQYLDLFKLAGWRSTDGLVHRITLGVPVSGVRLGVHQDIPFDPNQHPGTGHWVKMTPGMISVVQAFANINIGADFEGGSSIPDGVIEVYFGPAETLEGARESRRRSLHLLSQLKSVHVNPRPQALALPRQQPGSPCKAYMVDAEGGAQVANSEFHITANNLDGLCNRVNGANTKWTNNKMTINQSDPAKPQ